MANLIATAGRVARPVLVLALLIGASNPHDAMAASNPVTWYGSHEYDASGYRPHVAFNGQTAVEVHMGGSVGTVPLWYRVGTLNPQTLSDITWGNSAQYDQGVVPSIAIDGQLVVEVHQAGARGLVPLMYRVGVVAGSAIQWGPSYKYDRGLSPSVALATTIVNGKYVPTVVEVHASSMGNDSPLFYRVGYVSGNTIRFANHLQYDVGSNPSISFDGTSVLETHQGDYLGVADWALWYRGGAISGSVINFGGSHDYGIGVFPSNSAMFGQAIEVHEASQLGIVPLLFNAGQGPEGSGAQVYWYQNGQYDQGVNPTVSFYGNSYYGGNFVEVHQGATLTGPLWYRVGLVQATQ